MAARADSTVGSDTFSVTWDSPTPTSLYYNLGSFTGTSGGGIPGFFSLQITNSQVIVTDIDAVGTQFNPFSGFEITDLSSDPEFTSLTETADSTIPGVVTSFTDNTLTLNFGGLFVQGNETAVFDFTANGPASVTPEPSSIALLATGLLGVAGVVRRRVIS